MQGSYPIDFQRLMFC